MGAVKSSKHSRIFLVGAQPPPVNGMAAVNFAVRGELERAGAEPLVVDLSAPSLDRSVRRRLARLPRILRGLLRVARLARREDVLYMSVSGGFGKAYELAFLLVARLHAMRIYLHHHSYAYLERRDGFANFVMTLAGPVSTHITQSPRMAASLKDVYPSARRVVAISNAVFLLDNQTLTSLRARQRVKILGFISNISEEKGVFEFLDVVASLEREGVQVRAKLAGPFQDRDTERRVRAVLATLNTVEYVGPQYGERKSEFFSSIDVLLFPTRYGNEAEPIVNHEAMMHGVPVIAYGRGSIPELLGDRVGLVIDPAEPFGPIAVAQLKEWIASPEQFRTASIAARKRFDKFRSEHSERWTLLRRELSA